MSDRSPEAGREDGNRDVFSEARLRIGVLAFEKSISMSLLMNEYKILKEPLLWKVRGRQGPGLSSAPPGCCPGRSGPAGTCIWAARGWRWRSSRETTTAGRSLRSGPRWRGRGGRR